MSKQRNKRNKNRTRKIPRIPKDKKELFIKEYKKVAARENENLSSAIRVYILNSLLCRQQSLQAS